MAAPRLIGLDWGTSSLRAFLFGDGGSVLDSQAAPLGIMQVPDHAFAQVFADVAGKWPSGLPAIASGMIGSAQGWREVPYHRGPASLAGIASGCVRVEAGEGVSVWIVPGIARAGSRPEVMRGEETQIFGALALRPELGRQALFVLPGTHSKWVEVRDGRIEGFQTFMTGELFAALRQHTILGRPAQEAGGAPSGDGAAFRRGIETARGGTQGLAPLLFSARTLVLSGQIPAPDSLDYLSGLLIGDELRAALPDDGRALALIGDKALCDRYRLAMAASGVAEAPAIAGATEAGLWRVAGAAGLTAPPA